VKPATLMTAFLFFSLFATVASAATWIVDPGGGGDFLSIQSCSSSAVVQGDTCVVEPGEYLENLDFQGKNIAVRSSSGPAATTIDGNQVDSVVRFESGETSGAVLDGFMIRNGVGTPYGGGIFCENASPTVTNCILRDNASENGGGMIPPPDELVNSMGILLIPLAGLLLLRRLKRT